MKGIDTGKDKVKKICDVLRRETLEPAKKEAESLIQEAELKAQEIVRAAKKEAENLLLEVRKEIEKERNVFQSSLQQACRQALALLKQDIEDKLFHPELSNLLKKPLEQPQVIADLIKAVIHGLEKEGADATFAAIVPAQVSPEAINSLLAQNILRKLESGSVKIGPIQGGTAVKVENSHITIDITDAALKELVADYIRKDFRETLFRS